MYTAKPVAVISALLLAVCLSGTNLVAQTSTTNTSTSADIDRRIETLETQLKSLSAELSALKQAQGADTVKPGATNLVAPAAAATAPVAAPPVLGGVLNGAVVTGLVDTFYSYNANHPASRATGLRLFDSRTKQFALNMVELGLIKAPDSDARLGYNVTFGFGDAMNIINSSDPSFLQYLKEAYFSYLAPVGNGLQVDVGKYVTPHGAEVIESHANWNYSRGLLFNYAIPFYHFGMRAKYAISDKYAVTGYLANGWNNVVQDSVNGYETNGKTGGVTFAWTPSKKFSLIQNWMGGPGATPADKAGWRNLFDTVISYSPTSKLSLMGNGDYGRSHHNRAEWWGVAGYAKYQITPRSAMATRYEYFNDPQGFATGTVQRLKEVTATVERRIARHMISRLEYRHDWSNQPFFQRGGNQSPVKGQSTVAAGLMFVLERDEGK